MICRIWHAYTTPENADQYEKLQKKEVLPGIHRLAGYKGAQFLRRDLPEEVEFISITYFESQADLIAFAGEDYTQAVVVEEARKLLKRYDQRSKHYKVFDVD
jgi:heme-degrading monooxygenase HmoA